MGEKKPSRRHPHKALSDPEVRAAKPSSTGKPRRLADGGGLYLVVSGSGSKSWVLRTVVKGRRCDIGLGGLDTTSLKEARDDAHALRRIARKGGDPLAERRRSKRVIPTFAQAVAEVHQVHSVSFSNDKHAKQWLSSLKPALAAFGGRSVDSIGSADVLAVLKPMWMKKPETARRVLQRLATVLDWAKAQGFRTGDNPTAGIPDVLPKQRSPKVHHSALDYRAINAFIEALRALDASEPVKLAFEFTILCAARTSETLLATWSEIDLGSKTWTIPADRMKARVEHRVPLSDRCIEILERAQAISNGGTYVFPGRSRSKPLSNMALLMTLRRMGRGDITTHGFRSTFRDWASEQTDAPHAVCEAALAHTIKNKTEAAYSRSDLFERRRGLMDQWAAFASAPPPPKGEFSGG